LIIDNIGMWFIKQPYLLLTINYHYHPCDCVRIQYLMYCWTNAVVDCSSFWQCAVVIVLSNRQLTLIRRYRQTT